MNNFVVQKYRKKPVVIEAIEWNGANADLVLDFACGSDRKIEKVGDKISIETLEGTMYADIGDYIIKGISGEFYPCKPQIFRKTYEKLNIL